MKIACYINYLSTAFRGSSFLDWTGNLVGSVLSVWHRHIISTHHLFSKKKAYQLYISCSFCMSAFFYPVISLYSSKKFNFSLLLACSFLVRWEPNTLFHNIISVLQTFYTIVILVFLLLCLKFQSITPQIRLNMLPFSDSNG